VREGSDDAQLFFHFLLDEPQEPVRPLEEADACAHTSAAQGGSWHVSE